MTREDGVGEVRAQLARWDANTAEERVRGEAAEMASEGAIGRAQVTDEAHDARMLVGEAQDPVVVLDPRAGFDHHRLADTVRSGDALPIRREYWAVEEAALRRPRHALSAGRIVEVGVRVDDTGGRRPARATDGEGGRARRAGEGAQEGAAIGGSVHEGKMRSGRERATERMMQQSH